MPVKVPACWLFLSAIVLEPLKSAEKVLGGVDAAHGSAPDPRRCQSPMASSSPSPFHVPHPATPVLASWLMGRLASPPVNTLPRISSLVRPAAVPRKFWSACKVSSVRYRYMGRRKQLPQSLGFGPRKVGWLNPRAIHSNVCALQSLPSVESPLAPARVVGDKPRGGALELNPLLAESTCK
jgi:hypothetical protein